MKRKRLLIIGIATVWLSVLGGLPFPRRKDNP